MNDFLFSSQQLLTQYRARITHLQEQLGVDSAHPAHAHDMQHEMRRVQTENVSYSINWLQIILIIFLKIKISKKKKKTHTKLDNRFL